MSYAVSRAWALDYQPCQYGASRLTFRGPKKATGGSYITVLGGTETYGRFVARPFPDLLEHECGLPVLNLGCQNASADAFLNDPEVMMLARGARLTVLQVLSAQNMSNRFYRVHPRRNDRLLGPSDGLKLLYPEVDFTQFNFTKHMLTTLSKVCSQRFAHLRDELQKAWSERMRRLVQTIDGPVLVLWLRETEPKGLGAEPLFVSLEMVQQLTAHCLGAVEVPITRAGSNLSGMIYGPLEIPMASEMLDVLTHQKIASELAVSVVEHV